MRDGEGLTREDAIDAVRLIAGRVEVPVTADIERGFGDDPEGVADTVKQVIEAGAIGINIEDNLAGDQRPVSDMQERIAAARAAAARPATVDQRTGRCLPARQIRRRRLRTPHHRTSCSVDRSRCEQYFCSRTEGR